MSLAIAVDRLYTSGWLPDGTDAYAPDELDRLPSGGLRFPTVAAVVRIFAEAGLTLTVTHHLMFDCSRAVWHAANLAATPEAGAVVGKCDREAAVYALAHLRTAPGHRRSTEAGSR